MAHYNPSHPNYPRFRAMQQPLGSMNNSIRTMSAPRSLHPVARYPSQIRDDWYTQERTGTAPALGRNVALGAPSSGFFLGMPGTLFPQQPPPSMLRPSAPIAQGSAAPSMLHPQAAGKPGIYAPRTIGQRQPTNNQSGGGLSQDNKRSSGTFVPQQRGTAQLETHTGEKLRRTGGGYRNRLDLEIGRVNSPEDKGGCENSASRITRERNNEFGGGSSSSRITRERDEERSRALKSTGRTTRERIDEFGGGTSSSRTTRERNDEFGGGQYRSKDKPVRTTRERNDGGYADSDDDELLRMCEIGANRDPVARKERQDAKGLCQKIFSSLNDYMERQLNAGDGDANHSGEKRATSDSYRREIAPGRRGFEQAEHSRGDLYEELSSHRRSRSPGGIDSARFGGGDYTERAFSPVPMRMHTGEKPYEMSRDSRALRSASPMFSDSDRDWKRGGKRFRDRDDLSPPTFFRYDAETAYGERPDDGGYYCESERRADNESHRSEYDFLPGESARDERRYAEYESGGSVSGVHRRGRSRSFERDDRVTAATRNERFADVRRRSAERDRAARRLSAERHETDRRRRFGCDRSPTARDRSRDMTDDRHHRSGGALSASNSRELHHRSGGLSASNSRESAGYGSRSEWERSGNRRGESPTVRRSVGDRATWQSADSRRSATWKQSSNYRSPSRDSAEYRRRNVGAASRYGDTDVAPSSASAAAMGLVPLPVVKRQFKKKKRIRGKKSRHAAGEYDDGDGEDGEDGEQASFEMISEAEDALLAGESIDQLLSDLEEIGGGGQTEAEVAKRKHRRRSKKKPALLSATDDIMDEIDDIVRATEIVTSTTEVMRHSGAKRPPKEPEMRAPFDKIDREIGRALARSEPRAKKRSKTPEPRARRKIAKTRITFDGIDPEIMEGLSESLSLSENEELGENQAVEGGLMKRKYKLGPDTEDTAKPGEWTVIGPATQKTASEGERQSGEHAKKRRKRPKPVNLAVLKQDIGTMSKTALRTFFEQGWVKLYVDELCGGGSGGGGGGGGGADPSGRETETTTLAEAEELLKSKHSLEEKAIAAMKARAKFKADRILQEGASSMRETHATNADESDSESELNQLPYADEELRVMFYEMKEMQSELRRAEGGPGTTRASGGKATQASGVSESGEATANNDLTELSSIGRPVATKKKRKRRSKKQRRGGNQNEEAVSDGEGGEENDEKRNQNDSFVSLSSLSDFETVDETSPEEKGKRKRKKRKRGPKGRKKAIEDGENEEKTEETAEIPDLETEFQEIQNIFDDIDRDIFEGPFNSSMEEIEDADNNHTAERSEEGEQHTGEKSDQAQEKASETDMANTGDITSSFTEEKDKRDKENMMTEMTGLEKTDQIETAEKEQLDSQKNNAEKEKELESEGKENAIILQKEKGSKMVNQATMQEQQKVVKIEYVQPGPDDDDVDIENLSDEEQTDNEATSQETEKSQLIDTKCGENSQAGERVAAQLSSSAEVALDHNLACSSGVASIHADEKPSGSDPCDTSETHPGEKPRSSTPVTDMEAHTDEKPASSPPSVEHQTDTGEKPSSIGTETHPDEKPEITQLRESTLELMSRYEEALRRKKTVHEFKCAARDALEGKGLSWAEHEDQILQKANDLDEKLKSLPPDESASELLTLYQQFPFE